MVVQLDAHLECFGDVGCIAWIDNPKNFKMVVQASSPEKAAKELLISLHVRMSRLFGIDPHSIQEKEFSSAEELENELSKAFKATGKRQIKLQLA
jgi:hypothetical protein